MRRLLTCVLAAALCLDLAHSLQCYFCYEATHVQNCNEIKNCNMEAVGCKTVILSPNTGYPFVSGEVMVTRDCAKSCFQSDPDALGQETGVICCNGNLCNHLYEKYANISATNPNNDSANISKSRMYGGLILCIAIVNAVLLS